MKLIGNIFWLFLGGLETAFEYFCAGVVLCITIIGIPFGLQAFKLGILMLWPFGSRVDLLPGQPGCLSTIMSILWLIAGLPICITHLIFGTLLCLTIYRHSIRFAAFQICWHSINSFWEDSSE